MFNFIRNIRRRLAAKKTIKLWSWLRLNLGKSKCQYPKFKDNRAWYIPKSECYLCEAQIGCNGCPLNINNKIKCGDIRHPFKRWVYSCYTDCYAIDKIILLCKQHYN